MRLVSNLWEHYLKARYSKCMLNYLLEKNQGWRQEFSDGGLTLQTKGLKYGFQGAINAKNLRKIAFHFLTGG